MEGKSITNIQTIFIIMLIAVLISGCLSSSESSRQMNGNGFSGPTKSTEPKSVAAHNSTPENTITPSVLSDKLSGNLKIDNISNDLNNFYKNGWQRLYQSDEFDCSRMATYMWDYIRNKYKIAPEIVLAPNRKHAWLALKVIDAGDSERYIQWTIKGVKYYYIEATVPQVVKYEKDFIMGSVQYESSSDFYNTEIYIADDPVDANIIVGSWFNEFRLTKSDLDKLNQYKLGK